jgi:hypothetical protein
MSIDERSKYLINRCVAVVQESIGMNNPYTSSIVEVTRLLQTGCIKNSVAEELLASAENWIISERQKEL